MSDPSWSSVSWLLHCDGSNGSTTFTDSGPAGVSVSGLGGASISTSGPKFGSGRAALEGTKALQIASGAATNFGTGSFTAEGWVYVSSVGFAYRALYSFGNDYDTAVLFLTTGDDGAVCTYWMNGAVRIVHQAGVTANAWHHFALVRAGNDFAVFWNGVMSSTIYTTSSSMPTGVPVLIGASTTSVEDPLDGRLDELRGTKGVARYTANFTVPSAAFPENVSSGEVRSLGASAIGRGAAVLLSPHDVRSLGASALGRGSALIGRSEARGLAGTPLGAGQARLGVQSIRVAGQTALGGALLNIRNQYLQGSGGRALGAGRSYINSPIRVLASGGSALGAGKVRTYNDFTGQLDPRSPLRYVADIITPSGVVRLPISSWQATLQLDQACYGQAVFPAIAEQAEAIVAATEVAVLRSGDVLGGGVVEQLMVRFPVDTRSIARGPRNHTATLSGYFDAFPGETGLPAAMQRPLRDVRSLTEDSGGTRVRCDVDWLLRPGMTATFGGTTLDVAFINYYVPGNDQYMDVGERV